METKVGKQYNATKSCIFTLKLGETLESTDTIPVVKLSI